MRATGGVIVVGDGVVGTVGELEELVAGEVVTFGELFEDGEALGGGELMWGGVAACGSVIGMTFDGDALAWELSRDAFGDGVEEGRGIGIEVSGSGLKDLVGGNADADEIAIDGDGDAEGFERFGLSSEGVIGGEDGAASALEIGLNAANLLTGLVFGDFGLRELTVDILHLFGEQVGAFAEDLDLLLGLGELRRELTIVVIEEADASFEFRDLGGGLWICGEAGGYIGVEAVGRDGTWDGSHVGIAVATGGGPGKGEGQREDWAQAERVVLSPVRTRLGGGG